MKRLSVAICIVAVGAAFVPAAFSHCQVPCGIYDDELRVKAIAEDITTVEKCMKMIDELSADPAANMNQIVRWINTKEYHADDIMEIAADYFMAQRIKPTAADGGDAYAEYVERLALMHEIMYNAMKAKQTTDPAHVEKLRSLLAAFETAYFGHAISE
ncbi:MAG: superoxide dismutase [Ni] [Candidatus Zixiibacteriota bacterium]|jgi:nickel superoxide dismutase